MRIFADPQQSRIRGINVRAWLVVAPLLGLVAVASAATLLQADLRVTVGGFTNPESVALSPDGRYYVSNTQV